ncbi:MAG: NAD(P)(+) transhydrogenase (Re/Si-specific) subunit beta [Planctomycetota bacterium]
MNDSLSIPDLFQIVACVCFIVGLKMMGRKHSARRGNLVSAAGMTVAVAAALWSADVSLVMILTVVAVGSIVGATLAVRVKMTSMPELVAVFNGLGGLSSLGVGLVGLLPSAGLGTASQVLSVASVIIGGIAFSGSLIAYAKLAGKMNGAPVVFPFQLTISAVSLAAAFGVGAWVIGSDTPLAPAAVLSIIAIGLGVLSVVRIGGGDMPVVVALLNSYSGIAAALAGTAIAEPTLMIAGTLVGASGFMLTQVMCKAMNRSITNVLFAGFGGQTTGGGGGKEATGSVKPIDAADTFLMLEAARSVIIVPGYGMAVAKAQHVVKDLAQLLIANGTDVRFVIHPVAGRMPGHMNVLLAEAGVEYEMLAEPQDVNDAMGLVDVALVIGANDVVNPDARDDASSPLFGMPIINVDQAKASVVLKRSMASGFAGVENSLFTAPNTRMLFGDARSSISGIVEQFKA